jgi:hypothetical protein
VSSGALRPPDANVEFATPAVASAGGDDLAFGSDLTKG